MTTLAGEPGLVVWGVLAVAIAAWLVTLALTSRPFVGPRKVVHWFLTAGFARFLVLAAWWVAGWHLFCQRP